jgi:hypothetical protein
MRRKWKPRPKVNETRAYCIRRAAACWRYIGPDNAMDLFMVLWLLRAARVPARNLQP